MGQSLRNLPQFQVANISLRGGQLALAPRYSFSMFDPLAPGDAAMQQFKLAKACVQRDDRLSGSLYLGQADELSMMHQLSENSSSGHENRAYDMTKAGL